MDQEEKVIKGIWIDVENGDIAEVDITGSTLEAMQHAVGGRIEQALTFDNWDTLFVNEEALLDRTPSNWQWWEDRKRIFKGNGIIVGLDIETGETVSCKLNKDEVTEMVGLLSEESAKLLIALGAVE